MFSVLRFRIRDLGSEIRCLFDPWIRDPGWVKNQDPDPGSRMNIPNHISETLETVFWIKILKFFYADADADPIIFLILDSGWKKFGSGINIPDPQHYIFYSFILQ
jgi:hypothetical protein